MIRAKIAGVPVEIRCRHEENESFFADYFTDESPKFIVEPEADDLERIRVSAEQMAVNEGREPEHYSESYLENNAVHALLAEKLVEYGVLLMHGSALAMDGEGYIFTAKSGTGKSTHARLWRERFGSRVEMINDDKPMLRIENGSVMVYGTPWNGKHRLGVNDRAPLKAVIHLTRDTKNHINPIAGREAFALIYRQAYVSRNPETTRRIVAMEEELIRSAAFYRLGCNMEIEAAETAWRGMNPGKPLPEAGKDEQNEA